MHVDDYSLGWEHRARVAELQDIAAMDRLAREVAPAATLRRYAAQRRADRRGNRAAGLWRRLAGHGHPQPAGQLH
nr:hypothetical protein [uncultured Friedmanniella sp.]